MSHPLLEEGNQGLVDVYSSWNKTNILSFIYTPLLHFKLKRVHLSTILMYFVLSIVCNTNREPTESTAFCQTISELIVTSVTNCYKTKYLINLLSVTSCSDCFDNNYL